MPVSSPIHLRGVIAPATTEDPQGGLQGIIELVEETLQRQPQRCAHLHPAEAGKLYRLPCELWAYLCPVCEEEFHRRWPGLESESQREAREASRAYTAYQVNRAGRV